VAPLPELQRPYGKFLFSGIISHDGSGASSHALIHGDFKFEMESDPISKSLTWL
jgi:hypothetical protein